MLNTETSTAINKQFFTLLYHTDVVLKTSKADKQNRTASKKKKNNKTRVVALEWKNEEVLS